MKDPRINGYHPQSNDTVYLPAYQIPSFRVMKAFEKGTERKFLFHTWGGLGDQVCAEPVMRWALKTFSNVEISLATPYPELFGHLKFYKVYDTNKHEVPWDDYLVFNTIQDPSNLLWEFASHMVTHCVDFVSLCMFRCQMPNADKEINLTFYIDQVSKVMLFKFLNVNKNSVVVHPGKHWPSKTFPSSWYKSFINELILRGITPVIIGKKVDENVGYVDFYFDKEKCLDFRDMLNISEMTCLLQGCKALFTNDSSPIHIAASGDAFIGFVATCKHPDYIMHWRNGEFGYKMKNFGLDGMWNYIDYSPSKKNDLTVEDIDPELMRKILPYPAEVAEFYKNLLNKS